MTFARLRIITTVVWSFDNLLCHTQPFISRKINFINSKKPKYMKRNTFDIFCTSAERYDIDESVISQDINAFFIYNTMLVHEYQSKIIYKMTGSLDQ